MVINFECRKCEVIFDCDVGRVTLYENSNIPQFGKEIICPKCGQLSRDEVFLTDLGVTQLFKASLGLERKYRRSESQNLVYYGCYDERGNSLTQGMGRTLNISENGVLLETSNSIDTRYILYLTIAFEDDIMDFKGKIVFSERLQGDMFGFGIELGEMNEEESRFLEQYMLSLERVVKAK